MEETTKPVEKKKTPCFCTALLGVFVIVFAWWEVSWGAVALTVLGTLIILKDVIGQCCCAGKTTCCPPKS